MSGPPHSSGSAFVHESPKSRCGGLSLLEHDKFTTWGVFVSIPLGLLLGLSIPMYVAGFALILWVMNRIHPATRQNIAIASLGLGIFFAAMLWQRYQKYVLNTAVSNLTRLLSFIGLAILMLGFYLHGLERQKAKKLAELHDHYTEKKSRKERKTENPPHQLCGGIPSGELCPRCKFNILKSGTQYCDKYHKTIVVD